MIRTYAQPSWTLLTLVAALAILGCPSFPTPGHNPTPGPITMPRPTTTPTEAPTLAPTALPTTVLPPSSGTLGSGSALLHITGVGSLPLSRTLDNLVVAVIVYEPEGQTLNRALPVLELAIRGTRPEPCLQSPCRDLAGLVARYSSNLAFDDTLDWSTPEAEHESQQIACGAGINYHQRLPIGSLSSGVLDVRVDWQPGMLTVRTPSGTWSLLPRVPSSIGFGQVIAGAPWTRRAARSWLWQDFSGTNYGTGLDVDDWIGSAGNITRCPAEPR